MMEELIERIRHHYRSRCVLMEQRKQIHLRLAAFIRTDLGWSKSLPVAERKAIAAKALKMATKGVDEGHELYDTVHAQVAARKMVEGPENIHTKAMEDLAEQLPVWNAWAKDIHGFGPLSLAIIVGEAGDLSNYATHSKLWKRMCVAVIDGKRQGGLPKTAKKQEWIKHGYSRKRRSRLFTIGSAFEKSTGSPYRELYLRRKVIERDKALAKGLIVAPAAKIPKGEESAYMSLGHIRKRSQRYMEKKLLRDLWKQWRKATLVVPEKAIEALPSVYDKAA